MNAEIPFSYAPGPHWFAAYTNLQAEVRAALGIEAMGHRVFIPKITKWRTHARVRSVVQEPLLRRYVFVEIDPDKQGFGVRNVNGVLSLINNRGVPAVMPSLFVADMIKRQLEGEFDLTKDQPLQAGCRVAIVRGEFEDMLATVTNVSKSGREVSVKLYGQRTHVNLKPNSLRPAFAHQFREQLKATA